jgi:hypothetical protein
MFEPDSSVPLMPRDFMIAGHGCLRNPAVAAPQNERERVIIERLIEKCCFGRLKVLWVRSYRFEP